MDAVEFLEFGWSTEPGSDRTFLCTWNWDRGNTKEFEVHWYYTVKAPSGNEINLTGTRHNVDQSLHQDTFTVPTNALWVGIDILPRSETYNNNGVEVSHWGANWANKRVYVGDNFTPDAPDTLSPEIDKDNPNNLIVKISGIHDSENNTYVEQVEFQILKIENSGTESEKMVVAKTEKTNVSSYGTTKLTTTIEDGFAYVLRARYLARYASAGQWSNYSEVIYAPPLAPKFTEIRAESLNSVYLGWERSSNSIKYEIQYTTDKKFFDSGISIPSTMTEDNRDNILIDGLSADIYYFRIRAITEQETKSSWSDIKKIGVGTQADPPTTWTMKSVLYLGESNTVRLYWIHNSKDNSHETTAAVYLFIKGEGIEDSIVETVHKEEDPMKPYDPTSYYDFDISSYPEGTTIEWYVATSGAVAGYGDMSVGRKLTIYKKPELSLSFRNVPENGYESSTAIITEFPITFVASIASSGAQKPIGYSIVISSKESYEITDGYGRKKIVNAGDVVFNRYVNYNESLEMDISANEISINSEKEYTLSVTVSMSSGLTDTKTADFKCRFPNVEYTIDAQVGVDRDTLSASINMYAMIGHFDILIGDTVLGKYARYDEDEHAIYIKPSIKPTKHEKSIQIHGDTVDVYSEYPLMIDAPNWDSDAELTLASYIHFIIDTVMKPSAGIADLFLFAVDRVLYNCVKKDIDGVSTWDITEYGADTYYNSVAEIINDPSRYSNILSHRVPTPELLDATGRDNVYGLWVYRNFRLITDIQDPDELIVIKLFDIRSESYSVIKDLITPPINEYPECTLDLYRINDDGTFTTIIENVQNGETNFVTDPHPHLNFAQYRVVAKDSKTGAQRYYDTPPYPVKCTDIIIQWDETYTNSENTSTDMGVTNTVNGTMLRLPYNIDISENTDVESNLVKYVGRKNPVAYYGTHVGYTASWSTDIPKSDTKTLSLLRKLQVYMGNVYVREPSGTGYWAKIKVSFSRNHNELVIPVSLDITRVEGGM